MIKKCILAILALFTFFIGTGIDLNAENIGSQPDNKINSSVIKRSNRQQITFKSTTVIMFQKVPYGLF